MLRSLVFDAASKRSLNSVSQLIKSSFSITTASHTEKKVNDAKTHGAGSNMDAVDKSKRIIRLYASVCVERMPVITCEMNDLEKRYSNLINQINVRKSLLSSHELRHKKDLEEAAKRKKEGEQQVQTDQTIETALDFEDKAQKELETFKFGERVTSTSQLADSAALKSSGGKKKAATLQNIERVLDKKLILLVHDPKTSAWELPKMEWNVEDLSLRYTAERSISALNEKFKVQFLGNAPVGLYKNRVDVFLDKHYFFKSQYVSGAEFLASSKYDFIWIRKEELKNFIKNQNYLNCLEDFILDF